MNNMYEITFGSRHFRGNKDVTDMRTDVFSLIVCLRTCGYIQANEHSDYA